ncbi:hypothetical protein LVB77_19575 [Lysobacter sp. 5GHs7-4]|uniref:hypothetical protein n=1 Tax=Lysobacter sp. 5GHs7-4 TaxID=2904253 RepID=UPI001E2AAAF2|nr:hypothetical protein [Lysobacter sp. 5GHs7-4]UHQ22820.1 hypothetical protein LVB77_19575 [Lysobacter sp. 5GHs7-4]
MNRATLLPGEGSAGTRRMQGEAKEGFSYAELERRLRALPDGPASVLDTPRPFAIASIIGNFGIILGLLPSLLITFMAPQMWMVTMAKIGLMVAIIGSAPEFIRCLWVIPRSLWRWRNEQVVQLDHDIVQFRKVVVWVSRYPEQTLREYLHFVRRTQARLASKMGLLAGGVDKLGVAPLLIALGIQLKAFLELGQTPYWQLLIGLFLAIAYLIAFVAQLMRLRMQLYEYVLDEALEASAAPSGLPNPTAGLQS